MPYTENSAVNNYINKELQKTSSVEKPVAVILAGQPGAGKGTAGAKIKNQLDHNVITIDPDEMRRYHPDQNKLMIENDKTAATYTHEDASRWSEALKRAGIENKRNLILDGTLKSPDKAQSLCHEMKQDGRRVELHVVAVNELQSRLGIIQRYERQKEKEGFGRWVPQDVHDAAYKGMLASVNQIEKNKLADSIYVHDRDGNVLYENHLDEQGKWSQINPHAVEKINEEREKIWTQAVESKSKESVHQINEWMEKRNASPEDKLNLQKLEKAIDAKITKDHVTQQDKIVQQQEETSLLSRILGKEGLKELDQRIEKRIQDRTEQKDKNAGLEK